MVDPSKDEESQSPIDWETLARTFGSLDENGEHGSSTIAREAIEILIGKERLRDAVDYYVDCRPGYELARMVLWQIRPWCAMERCYEIFMGHDLERRRAAVELLRVAGDHRVLPWISEFLNDAD